MVELTEQYISLDEQVARYRQIGAQLQRWIDNPKSKGCSVAEATLTVQQLINNNEWDTDIRPIDYVPGFPETEHRRLGLPSSNDGANFRMPFNKYEMTIGEGFIASHGMFRWDGPRWNEIARACYLYKNDFAIESLRYVIFTQVINEHTEPLVTEVLYPRRGMEFGSTTKIDPHPQVWRRGTPEYQEILGTPLGKAVAYLVLSSFQRGTKRISQIRTFCYSCPELCMIFEIE
ncbi:hypothetical protein N7535_003779 [Penicillium sp. DV-2018c]|nr:hypothetical protein N7461_000521 [Penicillium sp. DV-2018c]KAJ5576853.1 hypothetical protein N7535_003779 [Penicillium sp. DV-2018c]